MLDDAFKLSIDVIFPNCKSIDEINPNLESKFSIDGY
jgi:hypothetical protein